ASFRRGRASLPEQQGPLVPVDRLEMEGASALRDDPVAMLAKIVSVMLAHSAADEVYLFPLTREDEEFVVVRALIPELETVIDEGMVKLGNHALRRLMALKGRP